MRLIAHELAGDRGGEPVFEDVNFQVGGGECLVVSGANGSGKSTLLAVIAGLLPKANGSLKLEGGGDGQTVSDVCHYLGHQNGLKPALTVAENLTFWRDFSGEPRLAVAEALDMVGLGTVGHLPFGYLSTGQRRRVAIARLLVSFRPIWLLDEPTAGLDLASERRFSGLMNAHLAEGGLIVAASHLPLGIAEARTLVMGETHAG